MKTLYFFTHFFLKKIDTFSLMSAKGLNDLELQLDDYIFACENLPVDEVYRLYIYFIGANRNAHTLTFKDSAYYIYFISALRETVKSYYTSDEINDRRLFTIKKP
ncbi:hypothetical protein CF386_01145 [Paraphotobacterium marinum]|uniref:Uncharacterized protein n=1 Tax=Paraphotobacterium marinum TaxID=1755811 RepID=A0A220VBW4_9GAMM|nr:hypothetical protein [Paraphotobacterium marinum]ASK77780.1 hypothetical protein CF386_01145 [Paraphotobacterium marinum]